MTDEDAVKMARQMRHHLENLKPRSNAGNALASSPAAKTAGYVIAEIPDWQLRQWIAVVEGGKES